jgi:predicted nucleic-acid-binding protein
VNVGLDTSVLLRLMVGQPEKLTEAAIRFLDEIGKAGHQAVVSDLVVAGTYFSAQYHYGVSKASTLATLRQMFQAGEVRASGHAEQVLALPSLESAKPGFVDRLIHADYTGGADQMATFEKAACKLAQVILLK